MGSDQKLANWAYLELLAGIMVVGRIILPTTIIPANDSRFEVP